MLTFLGLKQKWWSGSHGRPGSALDRNGVVNLVKQAYCSHLVVCLCVFLCVLGDVIHGYMEGGCVRWSG